VDIHELRKMTLPKLRDLAKQTTDLEGILGKKKEELVEAIAKAQGISFEPLAKDVHTIATVKQQIRNLQKQRDEILASSKDKRQVKRIRRKIKLLKRTTRHLAAAAKVQKAQQPSAPAGAAPATA
jgi:hypothetical protein